MVPLFPRHALTAGKAPPYGIRKLDFARQLLLTLARDAAPLLARLREACAQDIAELKDGNKVNGGRGEGGGGLLLDRDRPVPASDFRGMP